MASEDAVIPGGPASRESRVVQLLVDSCSEGIIIKEKVDKMLQRKVDLWPPEQLFDMLPMLLRVGLQHQV